MKTSEMLEIKAHWPHSFFHSEYVKRISLADMMTTTWVLFFMLSMLAFFPADSFLPETVKQ